MLVFKPCLSKFVGNRFQEFHEDLSVKNKEMERLAVASADASQQLPGDADALSARVAILHNKWRTVWRLSVERKKLLQDTLDHLLEVSQHFQYIALFCSSWRTELLSCRLTPFIFAPCLFTENTFYLCIFTALHMQGGLSYGKGVCMSVRPSVRHTREL